MKWAQISQTTPKLESTDVETPSKYSTFTSSDVIHYASLEPGQLGSTQTNNRLKKHTFAVHDFGSLG